MYQDNEDDWKILKEYKQEQRNKVSEERENAKKAGKRAERSKPRVQKEIKELEAKKDEATTPRNKKAVQFKIDDKKRLLDDVDHDIKKSAELQDKYTKDINEINARIDEIEEEIKRIRRKNHEQKAAAKTQKADPVEECPKKCRIDNIKLACKHKKTLDIPPYDGETPTFHVLSNSKGEGQDIIDVTFSGSCDHGKSQSAGDSEKYEEPDRSANSDSYCPRVHVQNASSGTDIQRPSKTRFAAITEEYKSNATPIGFLFNHLVFNRDKNELSYDAHEYDISFQSCKGSLPYKALVVAYPKSSWNVEFSFGYTSTYDHVRGKRKFAKDDVKTYDGLKSEGKWGSKIKGEYTYDLYKTSIEQELNIEALLKELKGSWSFLEKLSEFFSPINGFVETAIGYSEADEKKFDEKTDKYKRENKHISTEKKALSVTVEWPQLKLSGKFERAETTTKSSIGGNGSLSIEFAPLFGIKGKIDIIQFLLLSLGGPFGKFLRKISNMSMGYKDEEGKIDKSKSYIETQLELFFEVSTNVSGVAAYDCNEEKGWHCSPNSGISGFIGLLLQGGAKVDGKVWVVKFGAGAEFKVADESGAKPSGIELKYSPTVIHEEFTWAGSMEFNGLSIAWSYYANIGAEAELSSAESKKRSKNKFNKNAKVDAQREVKESGCHVILSKRPLFDGGNAAKIGT